MNSFICLSTRKCSHCLFFSFLCSLSAARAFDLLTMFQRSFLWEIPSQHQDPMLAGALTAACCVRGERESIASLHCVSEARGGFGSFQTCMRVPTAMVCCSCWWWPGADSGTIPQTDNSQHWALAFHKMWTRGSSLSLLPVLFQAEKACTRKHPILSWWQQNR